MHIMSIYMYHTLKEYTNASKSHKTEYIHDPKYNIRSYPRFQEAFLHDLLENNTF